MNTKSCLSTLLSYLEDASGTFPDPREGANKQYEMRDITFSAFSIFFMKYPSFLEGQRFLQTQVGKNNANGIFNVENIPTDNWIRKILDNVDPELVFPVYQSTLNLLEEKKLINSFRSVNGNLLIALDGTGFFLSNKICCQNCFKIKHKDGTIEYVHKALTPAIVVPGGSSVIPLPQEFIIPQDGHNKQDCENAASKRWLSKYAKDYLSFGGVTILGDDLYSRQPICEAVLKNGCDFIFVCKESSHIYLTDWVHYADPRKDLNEFKLTIGTGKKTEYHTYRHMCDVPLHGEKNALRVNWIEVKIETKSRKNPKYFAFVTSLEVNRNNAQEIIKAGRTRWKIENEHNNVLKNLGYHLEHNFGHGKENLSNLFVSLNILAFLFHTVLFLLDKRYFLLRKTLVTRWSFYTHIISLTSIIIFSSWDELLKFMIERLGLEDPGG